jgi:SAM-dependent methyltransferase
MKSWVEYWNSDHPIYVNERHRVLHYKLLARDLAALVPDSDSIVLDFGCGEALSADDLANHARKVILADAAPNVREKLSARFEAQGKIAVLSDTEALALSEGSLDLVILHSVAQYVPRGDFPGLIEKLVGKLRDGGRIVVGDILPPDLPATTDALALLRFGFEGGFLLAAGLGLVRAALSDYRKLRDDLGLSRYVESEMLALLEGAGLTARRLEQNPGHNQARMAFMGLKVAPLE